MSALADYLEALSVWRSGRAGARQRTSAEQGPPRGAQRRQGGWPRRALWALAAFALVRAAAAADPPDEGDLSYRAHIDSPQRFKCLYGYAADKTGDHAAAIRIFEDCIARWNDVYSMIWLAQILEAGVGVPRDETRAARLMERGAQIDNDAHASLARYHWGVALAEGRGVPRDPVQARRWLRRAAAEGVADAAEFLERLDRNTPLKLTKETP